MPRTDTILLTGVAGLVAGAMSMAAGEYVSVSSQSDTETADLAKERLELETDQENELKELTGIYIGRGLTPDLANKVALQLTAHDALGAHARDELGINEIMNARPVQAALASAAIFCSRCCLTFINCVYCPSCKYSALCGCYVADFFSSTRWISCKSRWRKYVERCEPRSFLGRARNGCNCWRWQFIWGSCSLI